MRSVASALSDPDRQSEARKLLRQRFAEPPKVSLKALLRQRRSTGRTRSRNECLARRRPVSYLIATNIISEVRKGRRCNASVAAWFVSVADEDLFLSTLVLGEIRRGVELVRPREPAKAAALEQWLHEVTVAFDGRLLGIDHSVAEQWGRMSAVRSVPAIDGLLAATALANNLTLVTRNDRDIIGLGATVLNPFKDTRAQI